MTAQTRSISNSEYHQDTTAISHSALDTFIRDPALYLGQYVTGTIERKQTEQMAFGSAFHEIVLESDAIKTGVIMQDGGKSYAHVQMHVLGKGGSRATNAYKDFAAGIPSGMAILDDADFESIRGMILSLQGHRSAMALLTKKGDTEQSVFWECPQSGLMLKARIDRLTAELIVDLKTCQSADPKEFSKSAFGWGYHRQAAMYGDAIQALWGFQAPMAFIAIEKTPPYTVNVFELSNKFVELGREHNREALARLVECKRTGVWRGPYGDSIITIEAPAFAYSDAEWRGV